MDEWPELCDESFQIKNFNSELGWVQEDSIEWMYTLLKDGKPTPRASTCPVAMKLLENMKDVKDAGFSMLDYGHMVPPRKTEGRRLHLCLSGADYAHNPSTLCYEKVDGQYFIQGTKVIAEEDGSSYVFSGEEPWGLVNMTSDSIIRFWCTFF
jgi:hypothetical protein